MKSTICAVLAALTISSAACAQENQEDPNKGLKATVPDWTWVDVKNPDPVASLNNSFGFNDSCGVERGGTVQVIDEHQDQFLVRYTLPKKVGHAAGTRCPTGVIFFIPKTVFASMTAEYERVIQTEKDEKAFVERLLE